VIGREEHVMVRGNSLLHAAFAHRLFDIRVNDVDQLLGSLGQRA
jgi:hypothetical protein